MTAPVPKLGVGEPTRRLTRYQHDELYGFLENIG